jgi:hypothetical protein
LHIDLRENGINCISKAFEAIYTGYQDILHATVLGVSSDSLNVSEKLAIKS